VNEPRVVVVVLTFNGWMDTAACLESLAAITYSNLETVIVDNHSTDGTLDALRQNYPAVKVITNDVNVGFAAGNNIGLSYALDQDTAYVLLLNNDVHVAPDFLTRLVATAQAQPDAALVGPLVYHSDEPKIIQSAGGMTRRWRFFHRGQNETDAGQFHATEVVDWLTGCAILARVDAVRRFGNFDPAFFLYDEEVDWCLRARAAGYKIVFEPCARVWHKGVQRNYKPSPQVTYYSARNELLLLVKHRAGVIALALAVLRDLRTLTSWSVRPRWRARRSHRDALARALRDFVRGRSGSLEYYAASTARTSESPPF